MMNVIDYPPGISALFNSYATRIYYYISLCQL